MVRRAGLWLRWSWRDLRSRWILVVTIALVIAVGTGVYAGLGATAAWRRMSNDASYAVLNVHDLRVRLLEGSTTDIGRLQAVVADIAHRDWVDAAEERLVVPTQVDASGEEGAVLVPGELVGVDVSGGGPVVDAVGISSGDGFAGRDDVAVLEHDFAAKNGLPSAGTIRVGGGRAVPYVGVGTSPEYFIVTGGEAALFSQGGFAVVFVPLDLAHTLVSRPNAVNDAVIRLTRDADREVVRKEIEDELDVKLPRVAAEVTTIDDDLVHRVLYEDIENDQKFWNVLSLLILAGATFAAFNLVSRIVDSQRREIGIGMALGVRPRVLAIRPLLVGAQIAVVGALAGVAVGIWMGGVMRDVFTSNLPLPVWLTPFQADVYGRAVALGVLLPVSATVLPVWRAVRVPPVNAIRTGHLAAKSAGWAGLVGRRRRHGRVLRQLPVRNLLRTPRRTVLTALGIGAAIAALVGTVGMLDTFVRTLELAEADLTRIAGDRLTVTLDRPFPVASPQVRGLETSGAVARADPGLVMPGEVRAGGEAVDVVVEVQDLRSGMWTPSYVQGSPQLAPDGIVLSEKAAADLAVGPGDRVKLTHPEKTGPFSFDTVEDEVVVAALHPGPMRSNAYMDVASAGLFGAEGLANSVTVLPAPGLGRDDVKRALFQMGGVASVVPVTALVESYDDVVDLFTGILGAAAIAVLSLAALIAFNSTRITVEERVRDHATMFAFGLPVRTVLWQTTLESVLTGLLGTIAGVGLGYLFVVWVIRSLLADTLPELGMTPYLAAGTIVAAVGLGVAAVAVTPLLNVRRLTRLDVPTALRVVE